MKKILMLSLVLLLTVSCNTQESKTDDKKQETAEKLDETPKGTWKVDKEFDEDGNLIRYDSIYSWSSEDHFDDLGSIDQDSMLQSMQSKFYRHFSHFEKEGFNDLFTPDSLFTKRFFDDDFFSSDFGEDFMDINKIRERMEKRQQEFLKKYRQQFHEPEEEPDIEN